MVNLCVVSRNRLRHNVIKAGVRMINLSYSRISLTDIAQKLQLDSPEDAEFIVAKVIRVFYTEMKDRNL